MHVLRYTGTSNKEEFERRVGELPFWYHSYYFDNQLQVRGDYHIGADIEDYGFPPDMEGMKILDIGSGAGWFSTYFEQQGAIVTATDARGYCDFDRYGYHQYTDPSDEGRNEPDRIDEDGNPVYHSPVSAGFWIMMDLLGSKIRFRNARAYDISPALFGGETFDLVFMGALLCHLRDPIGALMAARSVCTGRIIATTPVIQGEPAKKTPPRQYLPYTEIDQITWWLPNEACFRHWFLAAGFRDVNVERRLTMRCDVERFHNKRSVNASQVLGLGTATV